MDSRQFPTIDAAATGRNIVNLRKNHGFSVRDLQRYFGFEEPQAIYKWQRGQSLPSVDNLFALSALLNIPMNDILVPVNGLPLIQFEDFTEQQADACCSPRFSAA